MNQELITYIEERIRMLKYPFIKGSQDAISELQTVLNKIKEYDNN